MRLMGYLGLAQSQGDIERAIVELLHAGTPAELIEELLPGGLAMLDLELLRDVRLQTRLLAPLPAQLGLPSLGGSNAWAVAPRLTAGGAALLAGDPHLAINQIPATWCEAVIHHGGRWCAGATIPGPAGGARRTQSRRRLEPDLRRRRRDRLVDRGVPRRVLSARGRRRAALGAVQRARGDPRAARRRAADAVDLRERARRCSTAIHTSTGATSARAGPPRTGPVPRRSMPCSSCCSRTTAMRRSRSCARSSCRSTGSSPTAAARSPTRCPGGCRAGPRERPGSCRCPAGMRPTTGTASSTPDELPCRRDPPEGFVASANDDINHLAATPIITLPIAPYRLQRIEALLRSRDDWTAADFEAMQMDRLSLQAVRYLEVLRPLLAGDERFEPIARWDCVYDDDSREAAWFEAFYAAFLERALTNACGGEIAAFILHETTIAAAIFGMFDDALLRPDSRWHGAERPRRRAAAGGRGGVRRTAADARAAPAARARAPAAHRPRPRLGGIRSPDAGPARRPRDDPSGPEDAHRRARRSRRPLLPDGHRPRPPAPAHRASRRPLRSPLLTLVRKRRRGLVARAQQVARTALTRVAYNPSSRRYLRR